jgi:NADPH:quinone reductase-like Zn-dependent oxidoreductase
VKAISFTEYGPPEVLEYGELPRPEPEDSQVLVKVHAAAVNPVDWHFMRGSPFPVRLLLGGLLRPKRRTVPGCDVAGVVEAVGKGVTRFKPGDRVFGGIGRGSFAEYACAREERLALVPEGTSFETAAAVPLASITALQALRKKGGLRPGQSVLIDGASGGVGSLAIQIAKALGARVTAVCSTRNVEQARALGADEALDYTREDFTRGTARYDLVYGANAYRSLSDYRRVLAPHGKFVCTGGSGRLILQLMLLGPLLSLGGKRSRLVTTRFDAADLGFLQGLLAAGKLTPVIDRCYELSQVPDAIRYIEEGHARGKIIIRVQ